MGNRQRLTWDKGAAQEDKKASPPPQVPAVGRTEPADHPAAAPDPDYAKYKEGDPSAWAEDVHPGPYDTAAAPATPGYQEPAYHPAAKPGKPMSASDAQKDAERKAAKCIRVATAMLGEPGEDVTEEQHVAAIENQALDLMDLPDEQLQSTLERLGMGDEEEEEEPDKEASIDITARLDRLESGLERIAEKMGIEAGSLFGQMDMMDEPDIDEEIEEPVEEDIMLEEMLAQGQNDPELGYSGQDEEEMLAAMLSGGCRSAEEKTAETEKTAEEMLAEMLAEAEKTAQDEEEEEEEEVVEEETEAAKKAEEKKTADLDINLAEQDPMGLMDTTGPSESDDLSLLYHMAEEEEKNGKPEKGKIPPQFEKKDKDEEEAEGEEDKAEEKEEEAQEEGEKEGGKKAALRPQPKEPSRGVQVLGSVQKVASSEIGDLSSLWEHAPDVSSVFDTK